MQFIVNGGWLNEYVNFCSKYENNIGSISFDAQRKIRIKNHKPFGVFDKNNLNDK